MFWVGVRLSDAERVGSGTESELIAEGMCLGLGSGVRGCGRGRKGVGSRTERGK